MNYLIVSISLFLLLRCRNGWSLFIFIVFLFIYHLKYKRFNKFSLLLMLVVYLFSFVNFSFRNNCVLETHENYVIAAVHHQKVLIYTDEVYFENEEVEVLKAPNKLESLSNFRLFDWKNYCEQQNITDVYQQEDVVIHKKNSIRRHFYEKVKEQYQSFLPFLYGFEKMDSMIVSSGLHFSYLNEFVINSLKESGIFLGNIVASFLLILCSFLFPSTFTFKRILIGNIVKLCFRTYSRKEKIGIQYLILLILYPNSVFQLAFILPFLLTFISLFQVNQKSNKLLFSTFMMFFQYLTFHICHPLRILFFSILRKIHGIIFITCLIVCVFNLKVDCLFVFKFIQLFNLIEFTGGVPPLFFILFCFTYFQWWNGIQKMKIYSVCLVLLIPFQAYLNPFYEVLFLNVGQGDSIFIRAPFNSSNILIDIPKYQEDVVLDTLKAYGIHELDYLVITHDDSDHSGGKEKLIKSFKVKKVVDDHKDLSLGQKKLWSLNRKHEDENDNSLVYFMEIGGLKYLLMGDASKLVEKELVDEFELDCDILKVGHHGSKTSSSALFIQSVSPQMGVISVKKKNRYGHPHQEVLDILNQFQVRMKMTSESGAISIKSFLNFNFLTTSSGEFGIIEKVEK